MEHIVIIKKGEYGFDLSKIKAITRMDEFKDRIEVTLDIDE